MADPQLQWAPFKRPSSPIQPLDEASNHSAEEFRQDTFDQLMQDYEAIAASANAVTEANVNAMLWGTNAEAEKPFVLHSMQPGVYVPDFTDKNGFDDYILSEALDKWRNHDGNRLPYCRWLQYDDDAWNRNKRRAAAYTNFENVFNFMQFVDGEGMSCPKPCSKPIYRSFFRKANRIFRIRIH